MDKIKKKKKSEIWSYECFLFMLNKFARLEQTSEKLWIFIHAWIIDIHYKSNTQFFCLSLLGKDSKIEGIIVFVCICDSLTSWKLQAVLAVLPQKVLGRMLREEQGRCVWNRLHVTTARADPRAEEAMINRGLGNCVTGTGGERKAVASFFCKTNNIHKVFKTRKKRVHGCQTGGNPCQRKLCMLNIYLDLEQVHES